MKNPWDEMKESSFKFPEQFSLQYIYAIIIIAIIALASNSIIQIKTGQEGLVLRFGKFNRKLHEGLNFFIPKVETVIVEDIETIRSLEGNNKLDFKNSDNINEGILTGDGNLVCIRYKILYNIDDLFNYKFNISDPEITIKNVVESAFREVISSENLYDILSFKREIITEKVFSITQNILDEYNIGVRLQGIKIFETRPPTSVLPYYKDVQAAKADKERFINEAELYVNSILPNARGKAESEIQQAIAYRQTKESQAKGEVELFLALAKEYKNNTNIVKTRLYLETIESILSNNNIIVTNQTFNHLDINKLNKEV
ncbi:MAG: FtsH protease activity modulator HflK [Pseudomonadota bacterium]